METIGRKQFNLKTGAGLKARGLYVIISKTNGRLNFSSEFTDAVLKNWEAVLIKRNELLLHLVKATAKTPEAFCISYGGKERALINSNGLARFIYELVNGYSTKSLRCDVIKGSHEDEYIIDLSQAIHL